MDKDWAHLGRTFARSRREQGLKQTEAAERIGVSRGPIQTIEAGATEYTRITGTMRTYARLLGWMDGSIERVLEGGDPAYGSAADSGVDIRIGDAEYEVKDTRLPRRIREELGDQGEVLDTAVITLPGGGRAVVVVKGKEGGTPEEVQEALDAWLASEPHLKELGAAGDDA
ncbi:helix-turn-helix domain-containing protein [Streptomyces sp. BH055]|uniref:helix-turn-helix domain-containing protein n=1 Tax=Streptomyces sp. BH055 TaxID=3401173 RepID=UPI003BB5A9B4